MIGIHPDTRQRTAPRHAISRPAGSDSWSAGALWDHDFRARVPAHRTGDRSARSDRLHRPQPRPSRPTRRAPRGQRKRHDRDREGTKHRLRRRPPATQVRDRDVHVRPARRRRPCRSAKRVLRGLGQRHQGRLRLPGRRPLRDRRAGPVAPTCGRPTSSTSATSTSSACSTSSASSAGPPAATSWRSCASCACRSSRPSTPSSPSPDRAAPGHGGADLALDPAGRHERARAAACSRRSTRSRRPRST